MNQYMEMAKHIPFVRKFIDSGRTIEDIIKMQGTIGACAKYYFQNPITVMKAGNAYIHCNDGRHRVVAAQLVHVEIPVSIVQEYFAVDIKGTSNSVDFDDVSFDSNTARFSKSYVEMKYDQIEVAKSIKITSGKDEKGGMMNEDPFKVYQAFSKEVRFKIQKNAVQYQLELDPDYFKQFGCDMDDADCYCKMV